MFRGSIVYDALSSTLDFIQRVNCVVMHWAAVWILSCLRQQMLSKVGGATLHGCA